MCVCVCVCVYFFILAYGFLVCFCAFMSMRLRLRSMSLFAAVYNAFVHVFLFPSLCARVLLPAATIFCVRVCVLLYPFMGI